MLKAATKTLPALPVAVVLSSRPRYLEKKKYGVHWEVCSGTEEPSEINGSWFPTDRWFPETDFILKQWTQKLHRVFFTEVKIETAKLCLCMCMHMYQLSFLTWHDCKRNFHPDFSHPHGYRKQKFKGCWIYVSTVKFLSTEKYMLVKRYECCVIYCVSASKWNVTVHHITLFTEWEFTLLIFGQSFAVTFAVQNLPCTLAEWCYRNNS